MTIVVNARMLEALRLTRAGRLMEATAVIQSVFARGVVRQQAQSKAKPATLAVDAPCTIEGVVERLEEDAAGAPRSSDCEPPAESSDSGPIDVPKRSQSNRQLRGHRLHQLGFDAPLMRQKGRPLRHSSPASLSVPDGAQFRLCNFTNTAGTRDFKVYVPGHLRGEQMPLIIMLHGCTQSADDFAAGTQMNDLAEERGFVVAYPIQATTANGSGCWNWFNPADQHRDLGEPSLIAGITRRILSEFAVDPNRVYMTGLSAGGAAAVIMGAVYPDIYAAVGVHSGLPVGAANDLPSAIAAMRRGARGPGLWEREGVSIPTIVFHGAQDTIVHPSNGIRIVEQCLRHMPPDLRRRSGAGSTAAGRTYRQTQHLDAEGRSLVEMWLLDGSGHAWSGGDAAGSYTDPSGPPASREMIRFFLQHRRSVTASS